MKSFLVVWLGQVVSLFGSGLTSFALGVAVFQKTGSTTTFGLVSLAVVLPGLAFSGVAGLVVDLCDRRRAMISSHAGSGLVSLVLVALLAFDRLEIWHLYLLLGLLSLFRAVQIPAFLASTTMLVSRRHLSRASGMTQLGDAIGRTLAPIAAGALMGVTSAANIVLMDFFTFLFAILSLALVTIPTPAREAATGAERPALRSRAVYGLTYIRERKGLLGLLTLFAGLNFTIGAVQVLITPLVLGFASTAVLGMVLAATGSGFLCGGLLMTVWRAPERKIPFILAASLFQGLVLFAGGLRPSARLVAFAGFLFMLASPLAIASSQAIWLSKVPPAIQGRVFAARRLVALSTLPLAYLSVGPLCDRLFEPVLSPGGALSATVGRIIGVGPGRGVGFFLMLLGVLTVAMVTAAWGFRPLRHLESELPDTPAGDLG